MPEQRLRAPGPQHVAAVDRISPQRQRLHKRTNPAGRPRSARALAQLDRLINQPLQAQTIDQRAHQHHPRISNQAPILELNPHRPRPRSRPTTVHHKSDLLTPGHGCSNQPINACSGGHFTPPTGQTPHKPQRWIEAKCHPWRARDEGRNLAFLADLFESAPLNVSLELGSVLVSHTRATPIRLPSRRTGGSWHANRILGRI